MQRHLLSMFLLSIPSLYKFKICSIRHLTVRITYMLEYYYSEPTSSEFITHRAKDFGVCHTSNCKPTSLRVTSHWAFKLKACKLLRGCKSTYGDLNIRFQKPCASLLGIFLWDHSFRTSAKFSRNVHLCFRVQEMLVFLKTLLFVAKCLNTIMTLGSKQGGVVL